jgi:cell surface protein SprA
MLKEDQERKLRNKSAGLILLRPTYSKKWDWNRIYDLKFDLATSLTIQYRATANSFIREPAGSTDPNSPYYDKAGVDTIDIGRQLAQGGLRRNYMQTLDINYKIPIDKLPLLDWVTAQASYGSIYNWIASPLSVQSRLGNVIENSRNLQFTGNADLTKLYGKINYLKKLSQPVNANAGKARPGTTPQPPAEPAPNDSLNKVNYFKIIGDEFLKLLISVKRGSFTYSEGTGTLFPGFIPSPQFLGVYWPSSAPGIPLPSEARRI